MRYAGVVFLFVVASCGILPTRTEGGRDGGAGASAGGTSGGGGAAGGHGGAGGTAGGHAGNGGAAGMPCTAASCTGAKPVCDSSTKMCRGCISSNECGGTDAGALLCAPSGECVACVSAGDCTVATKPVCDQTTNMCRACVGSSDCSHPDGGAALVCDMPSGACVACVMNSDCATATKPICNTTTNTCRACATDGECGGPGVCMADGHCATTSEVVFVQFNAAGCPGANGSAALPYCAPNDAVAVLTAATHVIIIVGAANSQMTLHTTGLSPVIVGRKNSAGMAGSIPAGAATAIAVMSDSVVIRDLTVAGGTVSTANGVVVTGSGTNVTLLRLTASLGLPTTAGGLGIDAETGTTLTMNSCTVTGNGSGGILLNGANFDIEDTTVTNNGPGTDSTGTTWGGVRVISEPVAGPKVLKLVTVQGNGNTGVSCAAGASVSATGVLATGNGGGVDVTSATCGFSSCGTASSSCGAQP
jgi:hypothetical protein